MNLRVQNENLDVLATIRCRGGRAGSDDGGTVLGVFLGKKSFAVKQELGAVKPVAGMSWKHGISFRVVLLLLGLLVIP